MDIQTNKSKHYVNTLVNFNSSIFDTNKEQ